MENEMDFVRLPVFPIRPLGPKAQYYEDFARNNPELFKLKLEKLNEKASKMFVKPEEYVQETRFTATVTWTPPFLIDTSQPTCHTKYEAKLYKKIANADQAEKYFKVLNPATGKVDEPYTACLIERYRNHQSN